ncbi:hypothetical protein C8R44DRAFT_898709, partial [Mycena epipterygia]
MGKAPPNAPFVFEPPKGRRLQAHANSRGTNLVLNLMKSTPDRHESCLSRFATGIVSQIVAGHRVISDNDPYLHISKMVVEAMSQTGPPGGSPIDFFPVFGPLTSGTVQHFPSWFPGAGLVGVAKVGRPITRQIHDYPLEIVKKQ